MTVLNDFIFSRGLKPPSTGSIVAGPWKMVRRCSKGCTSWSLTVVERSKQGCHLIEVAEMDEQRKCGSHFAWTPAQSASNTLFICSAAYISEKKMQKMPQFLWLLCSCIMLYHILPYFVLSAMRSKQNISSIGSAVFDRIFCCNLPFHRHQLFNRWSACLWVGSPTNPV